MSTKLEPVDVKNDSDCEKEDYLKIYYPESSKFIEIPTYENGKLSLVDITAMDPLIVALKLINSEKEKLWKPVNGFFKEPTSKWGKFKVVAVLKDSINDSSSHNSINASRVKSEPNEQRCVPSETVPRSIKQESGFEFDVPGNVPTSSLTTTARQVKQEACDLPMESYANQYQSHTVASSGTENIAVKQEMVLNSQPSDESSFYVISNIPGFADYGIKKRFDVFTAAFIPKHQTERYNNMKYNLIHRIIIAELMLPFEDPLLFEKFFFLRQNLKQHPCLTDFFPESYYCKKCKKDLREVDMILGHTFSNRHMRTVLTQNELDKLIEAVSVIDYSDNGPFFTTTEAKVKKGKKSSAEDVNRLRLPDTLNVAANGEYEFFTNQFYPKKDFDSLKRHLIYRIIEANLKLPFNDPLFIEKILFLRLNSNYRRFPKMKEVFRMKEFCENCNKDFSGNFLDHLGHLLKDEHIGLSLTQDELNKLYKVLTEVLYCADGFYFKPKKRKNDHQNSNKNAKHRKLG